MKSNSQIIIDGFYIDLDSQGQFRIIGPNNHLFFGLTKEDSKQFVIEDVAVVKTGNISILFTSNVKSMKISQPLQCDIRTFRANNGVEEGKLKSFEDMRRDKSLLPQKITIKKRKNKTEINFRREYGKYFYECIILVDETVIVKKLANEIYIQFQNNLAFNIEVKTNDIRRKKILNSLHPVDYKLPSELKNIQTGLSSLHSQSLLELEHMLSWGKTSGDRFGTVFPRDWMESADLGRDFLTQEQFESMYERAMEHVNAQGEGWHEDIIGELEYHCRKQNKQIINRDMIDIEPHYILGVPYFSKKFIKKHKHKLEAIASLILRKASKNKYITFKKLSKKILKGRPEIELSYLKSKSYLPRGNWRDIPSSYGSVDEIIAPFDVNAVFYPEALKIIQDYNLHSDTVKLKSLILKWKDKRNDYLYKTDESYESFGIARFSEEFKLLKLNHLDESYLFFYSEATENQAVSFAERLLDSTYFYTPSGPIITEKNNTIGLGTKDYHGTVIWPKTTGFALLGLVKHLSIAKENEWKKESIRTLEKTLKIVMKDVLSAYTELHAVPELYFDNKGKPVQFSTQLKTTEESSGVQLWSAMSYIALLNVFQDIYEN